MVLQKLLNRFFIWRKANVSDRQFLLFLSIVVGLLSGFSAVVIKNSVHFIKNLLTSDFALEFHNYMYFFYPAIGILLVVFFIKVILKHKVGHGIPTTLYAISKRNGFLKPHNMFSSIITSALTVGFGGSVGLEGPTVATGAAWGSNLSRFLQLSYKQTLLLLACASAGAMSAIFKAPISGTVFVVEIIMLDLTLSSIVPLLFSSVIAALTSYFFLGSDVLYPFNVEYTFDTSQTIYYVVLGVLTGIVSIYFSRTYQFITRQFDKINKVIYKWLIGAMSLGVLIFIFPSLYGEGYDAINMGLKANVDYLFNNSMFFSLKNSFVITITLLVLVLMLKIVATSVTFNAGGVGGIFAPTLFMGVNVGLVFSFLVNHFNLGALFAPNFALAGMSGMIAGVLHGPLTGIFLIAETTGGYKLILPLMIVSATSYAFVKIFEQFSVYTYQLGRKGDLFTHDKDKIALSMLNIHNLIETEFKTINPEATLGDLIHVIAESKRNIITVIDNDNNMMGIVFVNDIRHLMFKKNLYDKIIVKNIMFMPLPSIDPDESMEEVARKFNRCSHYNLPVVRDNKYYGFVSRANVFSEYRKIMHEFSED